MIALSALLLLAPLAPQQVTATSRMSPLAAAPAPTLRPLLVTSTSPARHTMASPGTAIAVAFDRPVSQASVAAELRVFGRASGVHPGGVAISPDGRTATFTPTTPFHAGEMVTVSLSRSTTSLDGQTLAPAGYAFQFVIATTTSSLSLTNVATFSNRIAGAQTRIYGAAACDFDGDGWVDLATVNEVSADIRTFLNLADGSGQFGPMLTPVPIGIEASPNDVADLDGDGRPDMVAGASTSDDAWVLLGNGTGSFSSVTGIPVGNEPHGVVLIDVEGDGDEDLLVANRATNDLCLLLNNGAGVFGTPSFFEGGVNGEYGMAVGDMDEDGLLDVVLCGRDGEHVRVLLAQGDGTFAFAGPAVATGGRTWVVQLADLDGDGHLDVSCANANSFNGSILLGDGDGGLGTAAIMPVGAHTVSTDLGDLDGDGDVDWILSSFGGGFWRYYLNDGAANFTFNQDVTAPANPSCAVLFDADLDGDLDMALTDEIADVIVLMHNN